MIFSKMLGTPNSTNITKGLDFLNFTIIFLYTMLSLHIRNRMCLRVFICSLIP